MASAGAARGAGAPAGAATNCGFSTALRGFSAVGSTRGKNARPSAPATTPATMPVPALIRILTA